MVTAAILLFLIALSGPVALVVALLNRRDLKRWRQEQEASRGFPSPGSLRPTARTQGPAPAELPSPSSTEAVAPSSTPPPRQPAPSSSSQESSRWKGDLEDLIGGQWLTWIGVLAIFFGTAFFLAYDLGRSPLAGGGQLAIGVAVATAFSIIGTMLRHSRQRFLGLGLLGGGVALLFLSVYAGYAFHQVAGVRMTYGLLVLVSAIGSWLALRLDSRTVAGLTLIGALLTPLFVSGGSHDPEAVILFPYLIAVAAGANGVALSRGWPEVSLGALLGTVVLVSFWFEASPSTEDRRMALGGSTILWLVFAVPPLLQGFWQRSMATNRGWAQGAVLLLAGLAFLQFLYVYMELDHSAMRGTAAALLALVHLGMAAVPARPAALEVRQMSGYTAAILASLAIPIQFDLAGVSLGWAAFALGLYYAGIHLRRRGYRWIAMGTLAADLFHVLVFDFIEPWEGLTQVDGLLNAHLAGGLGLAVSLVGVAYLMKRHADVVEHEFRLRTPLLLIAAGLGLFVLTFENSVYFDQQRHAAEAASSVDLAENLSLSVTWAVYAALLVAGGFWRRFKPLRMLGFLLLGLTLLKVFGYDIQGLERGYRIASFVVVGVLLLGLSILYQRRRRDLE